MNAQTLLRTNGAKAGELVGAIGDAAEALAKAIEATATPLAETVEVKATILAKGVEERAVPLAEAVGVSVEALAKSVGDAAGPLAGAVETTVVELAEDLEKKLEQARKEVVRSAKNFKFGTREGVVLGVAVGLFAAVWLLRRMDRQAAAERLRTAGSRVAGATQGVTNRVGEATQGLSGKAGAIAGQASERVGQVVQNMGSRANGVVHQVRGQADPSADGAKQRLSEPAAPPQEAASEETPRADAFASDLNQDTREAIEQAVSQVEQAQEETLQEARALGLSDGMKVVAFDGTDIGRVQEVREDVFVLDRPKGKDLLVPLTEVARIEGTVAYLRVEADRVTKMGWEKAGDE